MHIPSLRALFPRAAAALIMLLHCGLSLADESSSVFASENSFLEFACTVDQLLLQGKEAEIAPLIQKSVPEGPLRTAFLARLQVLLLDQKLHTAVTRKREKQELGLEATKQLFKSLKTKEVVQDPVQTLKDLHAQHPNDPQICYLIASGGNRHAAVIGREMMRMWDVTSPRELDELFAISAEPMSMRDTVVLTKKVIDQMQAIAADRPATIVCSGMFRNLMNPSDGAESVLEGLQQAPQFPFALVHLLENVDTNGIGRKEQHFMMLATALLAQGTACETILNSAKAKYNDDLDAATTGYRYTTALGFPSPMFADRMTIASASIECCNMLSGTINLVRSQQTQQGPDDPQ